MQTLPAVRNFHRPSSTRQRALLHRAGAEAGCTVGCDQAWTSVRSAQWPLRTRWLSKDSPGSSGCLLALCAHVWVEWNFQGSTDTILLIPSYSHLVLKAKKQMNALCIFQGDAGLSAPGFPASGGLVFWRTLPPSAPGRSGPRDAWLSHTSLNDLTTARTPLYGKALASSS